MFGSCLLALSCSSGHCPAPNVFLRARNGQPTGSQTCWPEGNAAPCAACFRQTWMRAIFLTIQTCYCKTASLLLCRAARYRRCCAACSWRALMPVTIVYPKFADIDFQIPSNFHSSLRYFCRAARCRHCCAACFWQTWRPVTCGCCCRRRRSRRQTLQLVMVAAAGTLRPRHRPAAALQAANAVSCNILSGTEKSAYNNEVRNQPAAAAAAAPEVTGRVSPEFGADRGRRRHLAHRTTECA